MKENVIAILLYFGASISALLAYLIITIAVGFAITKIQDPCCDIEDCILACYILGAVIYVGTVLYFLLQGCEPLI